MVEKYNRKFEGSACYVNCMLHYMENRPRLVGLDEWYLYFDDWKYWEGTPVDVTKGKNGKLNDTC
jgi:hypothetical protein